MDCFYVKYIANGIGLMFFVIYLIYYTEKSEKIDISKYKNIQIYILNTVLMFKHRIFNRMPGTNCAVATCTNNFEVTRLNPEISHILYIS